MSNGSVVPIDSLTGIILAGGKSRRFGTDKAFACYEGKRFIDRILEVMQFVFQEVILVTNFPEKFRDFPVTVLQDAPSFQGPVGGIITALQYVCTQGIFVVACDTPLLSSSTLVGLLEKDDGSSWVVYECEGKIQPLCAIYRQDLLPFLKYRLQIGRRDLRSLDQERVKTCKVPLQKTDEKSLLNINTSEDLHRMNTKAYQ